MKLSLAWLSEWVRLPADESAFAHALTMAGFEVEGRSAAAPPFAGVVVARILSAGAHPQADKLRVCSVDAGDGSPLQIVCGAPNARAGILVPLARVGARLPGDVHIKSARLRGVESFGMLCSSRELGLGDSHAGLLELPDSFAVGEDLRDALALDDTVLEINFTPNRGDALSVIGPATGAVKCRSQALAHLIFPADEFRVGVGRHLVVNAPDLVAHQVLPDRTVLVEGGLNPGVPLGRRRGFEFDVRNAPTIIPTFAIEFGTQPAVEWGVRAGGIDDVLGFDLIFALWGLHSQQCM